MASKSILPRWRHFGYGDDSGPADRFVEEVDPFHLAAPRGSGKFIIECDASDVGLGAVRYTNSVEHSGEGSLCHSMGNRTVLHTHQRCAHTDKDGPQLSSLDEECCRRQSL
eukprot:GHVS01101564.1.p3 GENE.GHVS01101564.1~~GHVS01101564.1.p3  ORF type:complete len:111 (-),score=10.21 GHVS01101564.1:392-724(-)